MLDFPEAARLARLLGHPEWVAGERVIHPGPGGGYREALSAMQVHGLPFTEHRIVVSRRQVLGTDDFDRSEVRNLVTIESWANVRFDGEHFLVWGDRQEFED